MASVPSLDALEPRQLSFPLETREDKIRELMRLGVGSAD